jgi:hypothetical protein
MVVYETCGIYVQSKTTLKDKIAAIDEIIAMLETTALDMAGKDAIQEYSLNDGQTIIKTIYKGSVGIASAIDDFERIRQRYVNRLNGRMVRLVDSKNVTRRNWRYGR